MIPAYLKPGDTIGIVATARKVSMEELQPAINVFESWGLRVKFGNNLFKQNNQFSGTDAERAADVQQMLDDADVKAVIVARGGYGTVRIVDRVDFSKLVSQPKWIIGYSDVTIIHGHVLENYGVASLHATMGFNFAKQLNEGEALPTLKKALFGEPLQYTFERYALNREGEATGILAGGNLSVLYSMMGSVSFPDLDGKILFLEDLDEYLYHVDRMMMGMKRAGVLSNLAGLVIGGMTEMRDNAIPFGRNAEQIIRDAVEEYMYPVCFNFPAGHILNNCALKMGVQHQLKVSSSGNSLNEA